MLWCWMDMQENEYSQPPEHAYPRVLCTNSPTSAGTYIRKIAKRPRSSPCDAPYFFSQGGGRGGSTATVSSATNQEAASVGWQYCWIRSAAVPYLPRLFLPSDRLRQG